LEQEGIRHAIIVDNAAGYFMQRGDVDMVIVGADRIALNGDVVNKIGTYEKAVVAKENGIPFYVAAPLSTFDPKAINGKEIEIEERDEKEVLFIDGKRLSKSKAKNPSFDITPSKYIKKIITEDGLIDPLDLRKKYGWKIW
jgi:translation initiation factor eIF-2B subunit alpha/methylthioribose-1-phosphate isomerase